MIRSRCIKAWNVGRSGKESMRALEAFVLKDLHKERLDRLHSGTPHPVPLPFRRGEGEPSSGFGVVQVADYSAKQTNSTVETYRKVTIFLERFARWRRLARQVSLSRCLETVVAETHYASWLLTQPHGDQRHANVE